MSSAGAPPAPAGPSFASAVDERERLRALGASRPLRLAVTRADLIRIEQLLLWLVNKAIPQRQGRGRYTKDDTARRTHVRTCAIPNLRWGKVPKESDWAMLYMDPPRPANQASADFKNLMAWSELNHTDPRSLASRPTQRSILDYAVAQDVIVPVTVRLLKYVCVASPLQPTHTHTHTHALSLSMSNSAFSPTPLVSAFIIRSAP